MISKNQNGKGSYHTSNTKYCTRFHKFIIEILFWESRVRDSTAFYNLDISSFLNSQ